MKEPITIEARVLRDLQNMVIHFSRVIATSQQVQFIGFKQPQGRFLARESDMYPKCAN